MAADVFHGEGKSVYGALWFPVLAIDKERAAEAPGCSTLRVAAGNASAEVSW